MILNNGNNIPEIGLGTWLIDDKKVEEVIVNALDLGYRHIDTAQAYANEKGVGRALNAANIKREDIYLTTKVMAEYKTYAKAKKSIDASLKRLNTPYIDLILIHSPEPWLVFRRTKKNYFKENLNVWRALEDAYLEGKVKAIGVSNFRVSDLENIIQNAKVKPMVNQILAHIGRMPWDIINYCKEQGILVEAYSPIAHGEADRLEGIKEIALKYEKSVAQICLKYLLQKDLVVLPKASSREHLANNIDLDFEISAEDMEKLDKVPPLDDYGKHDFFPCFKESKKDISKE